MASTEEVARTDGGPEPAGKPADRARKPRPRWLRESWVVLLAIYCIGFGVYGESAYVTFDKKLSRVTMRPNIPWQYPVLVIHVAAGAVAVCLAWCQVWPWLRETHPRAHRYIGWVYYVAGVIPAGIAAFPTAVITPDGQAIRSVLLVIAVCWAITTVAGLRAVVQHRYEDHRRWMLRNVALTTTIITSRILSWQFVDRTFQFLPKTYDHQVLLTATSMNATGLWTALLLHLGFVEWYLLRPRRRRGAQRPVRAAAASRL
jgi:uncharacterized membrane protein YozB (DUF420 family)